MRKLVLNWTDLLKGISEKILSRTITNAVMKLEEIISSFRSRTKRYLINATCMSVQTNNYCIMKL
jgi:hypothetical protein